MAFTGTINITSPDQPGLQVAVNHSGGPSRWPTMEWTQGNSSASEIYELDWDDLLDFALLMIGDVRKNLNDNTTLIRSRPHLHPHMRWLWGNTVRFLEGHWSDSPPVTKDAFNYTRYDTCMAQVVYKARPFEVNVPDNGVDPTWKELSRFVERKSAINAEALQLPGHAYKWVGGPDNATPIHEPPVATEGVQELTYIWHQVPEIPNGNIQNCLGKVNDAAFDSKTFHQMVPSGGWPQGTLLFAGVEVDDSLLERDRHGKAGVWGLGDQYNIVYKFQYRNRGTSSSGDGLRAGWNHIRHADNNYYLVTSTGTVGGNKIFGNADFKTLFQLDA